MFIIRIHFKGEKNEIQMFNIQIHIGKTKKLVNLNMDVKHPDTTWHNFSQCNNIGF